MTIFSNSKSLLSKNLNHHSYAPTVACVLSVLFMTLIFLSLRTSDGIINKNVTLPKNIAYVCGDTIEDVGAGSTLIAVSKFADIRVTKRYLRVTCIIPPAASGRNLVINTDFAQTLLYIDGEKWEDGINSSEPFDDVKGYSITIVPSETERTVDITLLSELVPRVKMYLEPAGTVISVFEDSIEKILWPAFLVVFSIGLFFYIKRRKTEAIALTVAQILICAGISFNLYLRYFENIQVQLLKVSALCIIAAGIILVGKNLAAVKAPDTISQAFIGVGIVLWSLFLMTGNSKFLSLVLWIQFLYHLTAIFFILWYKKMGEIKFVQNQEIFLSHTLFCLSFLYRSMPEVYIPVNSIYLEILCPVATAVLLVTMALMRVIIFDRTSVEKENELFLYRFMPEDLGEFQEMAGTFFAKDGFMEHSRNVSLYVYEICIAAGESEEVSEFIAKAAFLHDIGKIMVPDSILMKESRLTNEEYEQMKYHALYGYNLFSKSNDEFFQMAAVLAGQHHERYDGNGYLGLAKDDINKYAAMTSVADVFDAVTAERSYKRSWGFEEGFDYILEQSGIQFSPENVAVFSSCRSEINKIYTKTRGDALSRYRLWQIKRGKR